ncbi:MAG: DUF1592 domain-containing protein [Gemmataceae bacterium]|nr:DUF1592 domain-containing protein [Gemmataceae bacterium]
MKSVTPRGVEHKRHSLLIGCLALAAVIGLRGISSGTGAPAAQKPPAREPTVDFKKDVQPFLAKHCYACHDAKKKRAGLALDKFKDEESFLKDRNTWEAVLDMLRSGEMPPKEKPRPAATEVAKFHTAVNALLVKFDCTKQRNVGRVTLRRLNKTEYNNTIRDLVGIDFKPARDFPADDIGYGFDNIGDVLSLSPLLLEKYLSAAESILDRAIVIVDPPKPAPNRLGGLRASFRAGETPQGRSPFLHSKGDIFGQTAVEEGDYIIRAGVSAQQGDEEPLRGVLRVGPPRRFGGGGGGQDTDLKSFEVKAGSSTLTVEGKIRLKSGTSRFSVAFLNPSTNKPATDKEKPDPKKQRQLAVRYIEIDGPYNPPPPKLPEVHRKLMDHKPGLAPREAAREIVTRFATRAFRRPVTAPEVDRLLILYDRAQKDGERFENCVRLALYRVLVSPHFLFRVELDPPGAEPGKAYPISEHALASRLSYFFWSTMPDSELFALAEKGLLRKNLDAQVQRMVKDPKSAAFIDNFPGQWLLLRNLDNVSPDPKVFPTFDGELRSAIRRETELFFEAILREDRSILDLLDADFSFVNERLAKHYGIEGVKGNSFQRVKLPPSRGGLLTQASILTLTSYPTRTSPVQRGKWVLETLLNTPPPPPPADVPELEDQKELKGSLRQRLEEHRKNPTCASCHARMDPIGFAFENYDPIGRWRDKDGSFDIDPSGVLPDGKKFKGPAELKVILRGKKELFARCLTEKVLTYALGRGLEYYDKCAVDRVLTVLEKTNYRFSTLLVEVVKSEPFQMRTATRSRGDKK